MGYPPGAVQRQILFLLNSCLLFLILNKNNSRDTPRQLSSHVKKIALLKREEGIGRPWTYRTLA